MSNNTNKDAVRGIVVGIILILIGIGSTVVRAETYTAPKGCEITASKSGGDAVTVHQNAGDTVIHFLRGEEEGGSWIVKRPNGALLHVDKQLAQFQIMKGSKWLLITPAGVPNCKLGQGIVINTDDDRGAKLEVLLQ